MSICGEFVRRSQQRALRDVAEGMLAQVFDLDARLMKIGRAPADVLDAIERESTWLRDKAFRRVWHSSSFRRTEAMKRTPRELLRARAREGHWTAFPVSPGPFFSSRDSRRPMKVATSIIAGSG